jgi:hypothetical protein
VQSLAQEVIDLTREFVVLCGEVTVLLVEQHDEVFEPRDLLGESLSFFDGDHRGSSAP